MGNKSKQQHILAINLSSDSINSVESAAINLNLKLVVCSSYDQKLIESTDLDLILLNLDKDGLDQLVRLKRKSITEWIPVVLINDSEDTTIHEEALKKGAFDIHHASFSSRSLEPILASGLNLNLTFKKFKKNIAEHHQFFQFINSIGLQFRTVEEAHVIARSLSFLCEDSNKVAMGLSEIFINAIEHGNLGISYEDKTYHQENNTWKMEIESRLKMSQYREKVVSVTAARIGQIIEFTVTDEGSGFDYSNFIFQIPEDLDSSHGRGIAMARMIAFDHLEYIHPGNCVKMQARASIRT